MKVVRRPWGNFKEFLKNKKCTVKIIEVKARQEISLQYHLNRVESWYFLDDGLVQIGDESFKVKEGSLVKVSKKKLHKVIAGNKRVRFLEIALGTFSEKDIVRLEDKYGRK